MIEYAYDGSLEGLFAILDQVCRAADLTAAFPDRVHGPRPRFRDAQTGGSTLSGRGAPAQPDLFGDNPAAVSQEAGSGMPLPGDAAFLAASAAAIVTDTVPDIAAARQLHELSATAYDCFVQGWMSELPVEAELIRFAGKVLDAARNAGGGLSSPAARDSAEAAAVDRGDWDTETTLAAAHKVWKETDRLRGLLRFSPGKDGIHIARCAPDHFVLPALASHFTIRFGETPWAVLDERRGLALVRAPGSGARLVSLEGAGRGIAAPEQDPWEDLWRSYHRVVNNESRANPGLQKQFMPRRYWKYLPEARDLD
jgi:hypothetical protein